jgi:protein-S-isoprenylcysteine O-methyltransferase Ste14
VRINPISAIDFVWLATGLIWLVGAAFTKHAVRTQSPGSRFFHVALAFLGFALLGNQWFESGWMAVHFVPDTRTVGLAGLILTAAGCLFAIWARLKLGANWSGRATVKAGHELIVTGPYSIARHPIYTGLLLAVAGTGLAIGEMRCILGFLVIVLALAIKMSQEEKLMMETFPETYPHYRERVKALIPGVF